MKRNEVIKEIEILLESIGYVGPSNSGDKVLDLVEELGMLPKPIKKCNINTGLFRGQNCYEWEEE